MRHCELSTRSGQKGHDKQSAQPSLILVEKRRKGSERLGIHFSPFLRIAELFPVPFMLMTSESAEAKGSGLGSTGGKA